MSSSCSNITNQATINISITPSQSAPGFPSFYQNVRSFNMRRRLISASSDLGSSYPLYLSDAGGYFILGVGTPPTATGNSFTEQSFAYGCYALNFSPAISQTEIQKNFLPTTIPIIVRSAAGVQSLLMLPISCASSNLILSASGAQLVTCNSASSSAPLITNHTAYLTRHVDGSTTLSLSAPH